MELCDWVLDTKLVVDIVGEPVKAKLVETEGEWDPERKGLDEWEVEWE